MKETSWCPFPLKTKLKSLKLLARLQDIWTITYFDSLISQIYPSALQLNKANSSDTKAAFLDLHLSIVNGFVS